jgi:hypothetical protein
MALGILGKGICFTRDDVCSRIHLITHECHVYMLLRYFFFVHLHVLVT